MTFAKKHHDDYPQFGECVKPITEKAICYALEEKGLVYRQDFCVHEKIDNIAFNKGKKNDVDMVLTSRNGVRLPVNRSDHQNDYEVYAKGHLEMGGFANLMERVEYTGKEIVYK